MGAPEGRGEVVASYVAAAAVEDYPGCGLGWFSGWGGHDGFGGSGVLGFCESFGGLVSSLLHVSSWVYFVVNLEV